MVMLFEHVHDPWQAQLPSDELSPRCSMIRLARRRQLPAELLPKAEHDATERWAAIQALMLVVELVATPCCRGPASRGRVSKRNGAGAGAHAAQKVGS
jgi:hypothetical protein